MAEPKQTVIHLPSKPQHVDQKTDDDFHRIGEIALRFCDDKIVCAGPISQHLWGAWLPKKFYHLAEKTNTYPWFLEGSQLAIRPSTVRAHIWAQENRAFNSDEEEQLVRLSILLSKLLELLHQSRRLDEVGNTDAIHLWVTLLQETSIAIDRVLNAE
jgi:hypothetical protein